MQGEAWNRLAAKVWREVVVSLVRCIPSNGLFQAFQSALISLLKKTVQSRVIPLFNKYADNCRILRRENIVVQIVPDLCPLWDPKATLYIPLQKCIWPLRNLPCSKKGFQEIEISIMRKVKTLMPLSVGRRFPLLFETRTKSLNVTCWELNHVLRYKSTSNLSLY